MGSLPPLVIAVIGGVAALGLIELWFRWRVSRAASRALDRARHPERYPSKSEERLVPESLFVVHLSETEVVCERPDGKVERVGWPDLQKVEVVTTDAGPMSPDVFWVL